MARKGFNPKQPRDKAGRWTNTGRGSGGGGGGTSRQQVQPTVVSPAGRARMRNAWLGR